MFNCVESIDYDYKISLTINVKKKSEETNKKYTSGLAPAF